MSKSQKTSIAKPATLERGEARYFHGRVKILDNFEELLDRAKKGDSGTSVLIQAAPGAGKTALLHECARIAGGRGYAVAEVEPTWFLDPKTLHKSIRSSWKNWIAWLEQGAVNIDIGVLKAELIAGRGAKTPIDVIKKGKGPLLLLLDEAQRLVRITHEHERERFMQVVDMLKVIHAGGAGRPVILLASGLGATRQAFADLDISRFDPGCEINLEPLDEGSRRAVIHDWLLEEGEAKGDPAPWINTIAVETHGWPQHIMAYVWPALRQLKLTGGELTPEGLETALEEGRKGRIEFYKARTRDFPREQLHCIARVLAFSPSGTSVAKMDIMASLRMEFSEDKAEEIFTLALYKGILDMRDNLYVVPIPSMHDWLVDNFARYRAPLFPPPPPPDLSIEHAPKEHDQRLEW